MTEDPVHAGDLHDGAFGRQVALQADDAAGGGQRALGRPYHVLVLRQADLAEVFRDRLAGDRDAVAVQITAVEQRPHQYGNAADFIEVLGDVFSTRLQVGDVRRAPEDGADIVQIEFDAAFMARAG